MQRSAEGALSAVPCLYLQLLRRVRSMAEIYHDLACLGLQQQGVGYTPQRFLRCGDILAFESIASQRLDALQMSTQAPKTQMPATYVLCEDGPRVVDGSAVDLELFKQLLAFWSANKHAARRVWWEYVRWVGICDASKSALSWESILVTSSSFAGGEVVRLQIVPRHVHPNAHLGRPSGRACWAGVVVEA